MVRGTPGRIGEGLVERGPLACGVEEAARVFVGAGPEQMEPRYGFPAEAGRRRIRQQFQGPIGRTSPQREVCCQQVVFRRQIFGDRLSGKLVHQAGCAIRMIDADQQHNGLERQLLGGGAPGVSRQREVLFHRFLVAAVRDEPGRHLQIRQGFGRPLYPRALAPGQRDGRERSEEKRLHGIIGPSGFPAGSWPPAQRRRVPDAPGGTAGGR